MKDNKIRKSQNKKINWLDKEEVLKFYNSFDSWSTYISNGTKRKGYLCEVKDGLICHEQILYLPAPVATVNDWGNKQTIFPEDGLVYAYLYQTTSNYYGSKTDKDGTIYEDYYMYQITERTTKEEVENLKLRKERQYYLFTAQENVDFLKQNITNTNRVLSKELDFIKHELYLFFKDSLPYKHQNGVYIAQWEVFNNPLQTQKGLIYGENGFNGYTIPETNYSLQLKFNPSFSNESQYYCYTKINNFGAGDLASLAFEIKKSLENYAKL